MNPIIRLIELYEDWYFLIRRDGLISTMPLVTREIVQLPYRHLKFWILAISLVEPIPEIQNKMPFTIRSFEPADLKLVRDINRPSEAKLCARRLSREHYGFIALNQIQATGYAWGSTEIDPQLEQVHLRLDHGDVLCNDAFTAPAYRRQGVQSALTLARLHFFQEMGYRRALCYIEKSNSNSLSVWQCKLNASIIGQIDFKRIGPCHYLKFTDSKP